VRNLIKLDCYSIHNPELFKEDISYVLVEKAMSITYAILEIRMPLDERPNMVQELIVKDCALLNYITEVATART
jgi:hypothetical protein